MLWVSPFQVLNQPKQSLVWLQQAFCSHFCQLFYFKHMLNQSHRKAENKHEAPDWSARLLVICSSPACSTHFLREGASWKAVSYLKLPVFCINSSVSGKPTPALSRRLYWMTCIIWWFCEVPYEDRSWLDLMETTKHRRVSSPAVPQLIVYSCLGFLQLIGRLTMKNVLSPRIRNILHVLFSFRNLKVLS